MNEPYNKPYISPHNAAKANGYQRQAIDDETETGENKQAESLPYSEGITTPDKQAEGIARQKRQESVWRTHV